MKKLFNLSFTALLILLALTTPADFSCSKHEDIPDPTIEGHWVNLTLAHPDWKYQFNDHLLTQYIVDLGDTIVWQEYTYAVRHDTILIGGDVNNPMRKWKVTFWCDSIAEVHNITPGVMIAPVIYLRKTQ